MLFRSNELLFRSNELLFRSNEILFRSNKIIFRGNEIIFRSNEIIFRGNEIGILTTFFFLCPFRASVQTRLAGYDVVYQTIQTGRFLFDRKQAKKKKKKIYVQGICNCLVPVNIVHEWG